MHACTMVFDLCSTRHPLRPPFSRFSLNPTRYWYDLPDTCKLFNPLPSRRGIALDLFFASIDWRAPAAWEMPRWGELLSSQTRYFSRNVGSCWCSFFFCPFFCQLLMATHKCLSWCTHGDNNHGFTCAARVLYGSTRNSSMNSHGDSVLRIFLSTELKSYSGTTIALPDYELRWHGPVDRRGCDTADDCIYGYSNKPTASHICTISCTGVVAK